jgi:hypothetical protein
MPGVCRLPQNMFPFRLYTLLAGGTVLHSPPICYLAARKNSRRNRTRAPRLAQPIGRITDGTVIDVRKLCVWPSRGHHADFSV